MGRVHVVVDGSNIATEGRVAPSLAQIDAAVRSFIEQHGYGKVTVIVDATFGHRIDAKERRAFEDAILNGELVTPPAGTIGRGDAFILQVAKLADADVLSNDSFQELHAEHPWLFEAGRLWGGKPVPEVGWVFVTRSPVRGVTSRRAVQAAKKAKVAKAGPAPKAQGKAAASSAPKKATTAPRKTARARRDAEPKEPAKPPKLQQPRQQQPPPQTDADAEVSEIASASSSSRRRRRRGGGGESSRPPINEQLVYAAFVIEHPIGATVTGTVERFSSHGAYIRVAGAVAYVPLRSLGDPPPRSAREVLSLGEERAFVVTRFDPATRGIDVVPGDVDAVPTSVPRGTGASSATADDVSSESTAEEALVSPAAKKAAKRKPAAKRAPAKRKTAAKRAPAKKKTAAKRAPAKKKTAAKRAPAKKKTAAKRAPAKKKTAAKRAPAKKKTAAKRAPAKKKTAAKRAPAKRKTAARKAAAKKR
jgi:hypothetical protein